MRKLIFLLGIFTSLGFAAASPSPLINNISNRTTISLDGQWQAIVDPYETGVNARFYLNAKARTNTNFWNTISINPTSCKFPATGICRRKNCSSTKDQSGTKKSFSYHKREHTRVLVYLGAANYFTRVYINGQASENTKVGYALQF